MPADWSRPIDVERLADAGESREIDASLSSLPRLAPLLAADDGKVHAAIRFDRERGQPVAEVAVEARVPLRCQRCLRPVWFGVSERSKVWLVTDPARADELDPGIEPTLAPEGRIALRDLAEEELLLALPLVPRHERGEECGTVEEAAPQSEAVQKPFAGLGELLKRGSK
ncbi:MAG: YceD family protein [Steroidobacteraceae bacterium]